MLNCKIWLALTNQRGDRRKGNEKVYEQGSRSDIDGGLYDLPDRNGVGGSDRAGTGGSLLGKMGIWRRNMEVL